MLQERRSPASQGTLTTGLPFPSPNSTLLPRSHSITVDRHAINCVRPARTRGPSSCDHQARPSTSFVDDTIDLPWRNFPEYRVRDKVQREVPLFLEIPEFPYNTLVYRWQEAPVPITSSIRSVYRHKYRQTHTLGHTWYRTNQGCSGEGARCSDAPVNTSDGLLH